MQAPSSRFQAPNKIQAPKSEESRIVRLLPGDKHASVSNKRRGSASGVAQVANLLFRRLPTCRCSIFQPLRALRGLNMEETHPRVIRARSPKGQGTAAVQKLRQCGALMLFRQVVECGSPLPLFRFVRKDSGRCLRGLPQSKSFAVTKSRSARRGRPANKPINGLSRLDLGSFLDLGSWILDLHRLP
jgi:hypothetical protein